jgi:hypothetical protein
MDLGWQPGQQPIVPFTISGQEAAKIWPLLNAVSGFLFHNLIVLNIIFLIIVNLKTHVVPYQAAQYPASYVVESQMLCFTKIGPLI